MNIEVLKEIYRKENNKRVATKIKRDVVKKNASNNDSLISLSKEQSEAINLFWKEYGIKPDLNYFRWIYSVTGIFDERYISEDVYARYLMPHMYDVRRAVALDDKNMYDLMFHDVKKPLTIVHNVNGEFLDGDYNPISLNEAVKLVEKFSEKVVIKPSLGSCKGAGVRLIETKHIREVLNSYNSDFIIQECIVPHKDIASLNEKSSNVIRITSLFLDGEVHVLSPAIRVGDDDRFIDQGGEREFCIGILPDGRLRNQAVSTKNGIVRVTKLPNGKIFGGMKIPEYEKMIEIIKKIHPRMAAIPLIGWDILVNESSEVVLLECNLHWPGIVKYQECNGPFFGNLTKRVLEKFTNK